jgi:hypothetical protein
MRKLLMMIMMCACLTTVSAQKIKVKSVSLRQTDLRASTQPRTDANGKICAIVRVAVVGVSDLKFPDAVGSVDYSLGEYIVYVPVGLEKLRYYNTKKTINGSITFDDYDLEVMTKRVYSVVFESDSHLRAAIFAVQPATAQLTFNGAAVKLDEAGMAIVEKPVGEYSYEVKADGYVSRQGRVKLTDQEITTTTNVLLEQVRHALNINCTPSNANLFIDNTDYGTLDKAGDLQLPDGEHIIRLTAKGYNEYEQAITVAGQPVALNVAMQQMEERIVKHTDERTRTHVNIRPGYYLGIGGELYDKSQYLGHDWGLRFSFHAMQHTAGIFAIREGIAGGIMNPTNGTAPKFYENLADSAKTWFLEIPLQVGVSIPFGAFNQHLFSILGGAYGKMLMTDVWKTEKDDNGYETVTSDKTSKTKFDYGLRGSIILDISSFSIAAEASLSLAKFEKLKEVETETVVATKEDNKPNLYIGVTVAYKF